MSDLKKYLEKQMKDPEFVKEHQSTSGEFELARALIAARIEQGITQKELARRSGLRQSNISRIESGNCSPTVTTLQAIANGLGRDLVIDFK